MARQGKEIVRRRGYAENYLCVSFNSNTLRFFLKTAPSLIQHVRTDGFFFKRRLQRGARNS
jgi:hypothetical protein